MTHSGRSGAIPPGHVLLSEVTLFEKVSLLSNNERQRKQPSPNRKQETQQMHQPKIDPQKNKLLCQAARPKKRKPHERHIS
jgi:hypothetical protein